MFEHKTDQEILKRMLAQIPDSVDKREGSVIYDALAPMAKELADIYMDLDTIIQLSFADTSSGEFLERRTAESGVERAQASQARRKALFYGSGN